MPKLTGTVVTISRELLDEKELDHIFSCTSEDLLLQAYTQEFGLPKFSTELVPAKSQHNSVGTGLGLLVTA